MRISELFAFIQRRHNIYCARQRGEGRASWTHDPILQKYRFCNVYRELDKTTIWIRENWRDPHRKDLDVWFAMVVARLLNLPASMSDLGYPVPWVAAHFKAVLRARKESGNRVFAPAYMIRADAGAPGQLKTDYLAARVLTPLWRDRETVRPRRGDTLATFFARLRGYRDMGPFIAGQVVADVKFVEPLHSAEDLWKWATPGPGSLRGLNRICGYELKKPWKGNAWAKSLELLQIQIDPLMRAAALPRLSAQDLQNCLCEWDKYERVRLGEGRPKQLYV